MAKLRHIAVVVRDPEQSAKFFEQAFDMKVVSKARRGLYVSDGVMNVALLKVESVHAEWIWQLVQAPVPRSRFG